MSDLMQQLLNIFGLDSAILSSISNLQEFIPVLFKFILALGLVGIIFRFFFSFSSYLVKGRGL